MTDLSRTVLIIGGIAAVLVVLVRVFVLKLPVVGGDPLDDPKVEWQVQERVSIVGSTEWQWQVRVGDKGCSEDSWTKEGAVGAARDAARILLGNAGFVGKTRPCPLCGEPSEFGKETDTVECARLLKSARDELAQLPDVKLD